MIKDPELDAAPADDDYGASFFVDSYEKLVRSADKVFGAFCLITLALVAYGYVTGVAPFRAVAVVGCFLSVNILMSRVGTKAQGRQRVHAELLRVFLINGLLCPLALWGTDGSALPWWTCYFIPTLGAAVMLGGLYSPLSWQSVLGVAFWGVNLGVAGVFFLRRLSLAQQVLQVSVLMMTGFVFLVFIRTFVEEARAEHRRFHDAVFRLKSAQAQLIESGKLAALGQMAGSIAHEINTPLATMRLALRQLRRATQNEVVDRQVVLERAELMDTIGNRIETIVRSLLAFCHDSESEPFREVTIGKIVSETMVFCSARFRARGIALEVMPDALDTTIVCQPVQLSQVLLNLLNNAYDAVAARPTRWVRIRAVDAGEQLRIYVEDSGAGVPGDVQSKIFEPFFTTKGAGVGTGLGLSISKRIAHAHGGSLSLDTSAAYTSFVVALAKREQARKFDVDALGAVR
jgi:signal transduction histidine kinase